jgi:hypothetical protein
VETRNGLFRCELGTASLREGRKKGALRGEQRAAAQTAGNDTASVEIFFLQAPARRSCDGLDFGPLLGA